MTPPDWFTAAIKTDATDHAVMVAGTRIHYRRYERQPGKPTLLFVHGHGAHCHWWDFIAPAFTDDFNVVSMDMAGAGDSGHRLEYSALTFAEEIMAVARAESAIGPEGDNRPMPYLVGHSFGGSMSRVAAWLHGNELSGLVLADSVVSDRRSTRPAVPASSGRIRYYQSLDQGKRRFRLRPPQPCQNTYILDYIAAHSLRQDDKGWCFKLDQDVFAKLVDPVGIELPDGITTLRDMPCPVALVYGEQSRFFPPEAIELVGGVIPEHRIASVPDAHHHLFLDQPQAFIGALKRMLTALGD